MQIRGGWVYCFFVKYLDGTRQELLVNSRQFPGAVLVHRGFDKARLHWHAGFEILYVRQCLMQIVVDGHLSVIGDGNSLLVAPRSMHAVTMSREETDTRIPEALSITIDPLKLMLMYPDIVQVQGTLDYGSISDAMSDSIGSHCETIFLALSGSQSTRWLIAGSALYEMLAEILGYAQNSPLMVNNTEHDVMPLVLAYIQEHYSESLHTTQVASLFGYSREHFSRLFKTCTSITFHQYVRAIRLEHACRFLAADRAVSDHVWQLSGFANDKMFRKEFMKEFECSPEEYADKLGMGEGSSWSAAIDPLFPGRSI